MQQNELFRGCSYYYEKIRNIKLGESKIDFLGLNLPPTCNYNCEFCFSSYKNKLKNNFGKKLTINEYKKIIKIGAKMGVKQIEISGEGEPLLYLPQLKAIISCATEQGIHTLIHTNGSLLTPEIISFLNKMNVSIMISISYVDENKFNKFTDTRNQLNQVQRNITQIANTFTNKLTIEEGYKIYRIGINAEKRNNNSKDLIKLRRLCKRYNLFFNIASVIGGCEHPTTSKQIMDTKENSIIVCNSSKPEIGHNVCGLFHYGLGIRGDGEVLFETHSYNSSKIIGNIRNQKIDVLIKKNKYLQKIYFREFNDGGFCPLRNPRLNEFVEKIKCENI